MPRPASAVPRIATKARLQRDEVRERLVLLYPEGVVTLNESGAEILYLCDGLRTLSSIVDTLSARYGGAVVDRDVAEFLDGLSAKGLVTWS